MKTSRLTWCYLFGHRNTRSAFSGQIDKNALGQPWLDRKSKSIKIIPKQHFSCFYFLHQTQATRWFSSILTKFDPRLTFEGTGNPNFDPNIRIGWDQHHCKYYQIPFPKTIHGSKLKFKQLRYPENHAKCISTLLKVITFYSTVGFSFSLVSWKLDIYFFPRTSRFAQSESEKTFKYTSEVELGKCQNYWCQQGGQRPYKVRRKPNGHFSAINASKPLILPKKKKKEFLGWLSLSLSKHIQTPSNFLDSHIFSTIIKVVLLHPIFLSLVPYLGFEI